MADETPTLTLAEYVKAVTGDTWAAQCEAEATALTTRRIGTATVPAEVRARAILEAGAELYYRRDLNAGNAQLDDSTAQPRRARDLRRIIDDVLGPYLAPGIY